MVPGAPPANVRPYRYPHFQKDEIEKLVKEMLTSGDYSAQLQPFFLTSIASEKERWHMAILCGLPCPNQITVLFKYPIPVIFDELLDELHGAHYIFQNWI